MQFGPELSLSFSLSFCLSLFLSLFSLSLSLSLSRARVIGERKKRGEMFEFKNSQKDSGGRVKRGGEMVGERGGRKMKRREEAEGLFKAKPDE
jgi:hypothetical protein